MRFFQNNKKVPYTIISAKNYSFVPTFFSIFSEPLGICYIDTSTLDGESNLKVRQSLPETMDIQSMRSLDTFRPTIQTEEPLKSLYKFHGNIRIRPDKSQEKGQYQ